MAQNSQLNLRTRQDRTGWDIVISPQSDTILYVPEKFMPLPFCGRSMNAAALLAHCEMWRSLR